MTLIADGLLIATCLTTALYCLVLSRRLRRLSDTDEGIGQQILRLNTALAETKAAVSEIRKTAQSATEQLEADIEAAKRQSDQLQRQIARALKSGVASASADTAPASTPAPARTDRAEAPVAEDRAKDKPTAAQEPDIVDFDAVVSPENELDEDLRMADEDATAENVEEEIDDVAEAEEHWPFDESDLNTGIGADSDTAASDEKVEGDAAEAPNAGETAKPARRPGSDEGDTGLLRVERMAV